MGECPGTARILVAFGSLDKRTAQQIRAFAPGPRGDATVPFFQGTGNKGASIDG